MARLLRSPAWGVSGDALDEAYRAIVVMPGDQAKEFDSEVDHRWYTSFIKG
jgi:hypothetical protein